MLSRYDMVQQCDSQTDGQTDWETNRITRELAARFAILRALNYRRSLTCVISKNIAHVRIVNIYCSSESDSAFYLPYDGKMSISQRAMMLWGWEGNRRLGSNGSLPPGGWIKSPAGWLPVHRDQLRAQRSVTSMGCLCLFTVDLNSAYTMYYFVMRQCDWLSSHVSSTARIWVTGLLRLFHFCNFLYRVIFIYDIWYNKIWLLLFSILTYVLLLRPH